VSTDTAPLPVTSPFAAPARRTIQLAFAVIYVVWGVSYAVNRIMALALPPLLAAGCRFLLAGSLLTCIAYARGLALPVRSRDWRIIGAAAVLGVLLANGLNVLALKHIASNQSALINASTAFWIAWLGMYGRRATAVSGRTWLGLLVGFGGVAVLVCARGFGPAAQLPWQLIALCAPLCWALATAVMRESQTACDPLAFTACYLALGGALLLVTGLASGDAAHWSWSPAGIGSIIFLAVFSSTFGFVAYTYLMLHETPARLGTYAFVNPAIAVLVGWSLLGESLDVLQLVGAAIIFLGVMLVRKQRLGPRAALRSS
jgi:drug/metabolite transporter (DMT)-like permease